MTYTYDAAGNRTSLTRSNGTASALPSALSSVAYDPANEQTVFGGIALAYDENGNLTNDGANSYTWDARNRLTLMTGNVTAEFKYDPLGRRVSKMVNGSVSQFLYDGKDLIAEIGGSAVSTSYLRHPSIIDEAFARQSVAGGEFFHADVLGSSAVLTNSNGLTGATYFYDPFGNTVGNGSSSNPFQYTGRENDQTGLYYYRARYYSPTRGRFTSQDPLGLFLLSDNLYVYSQNNPIAEKDPSGEMPLVVGGALIGAGYGAVTEGMKAYMDGKGSGDIGNAFLRGGAAGGAAGAAGAAAVLITRDPRALGAISGGVYSLVNQRLDPARKQFSFCEFAKDVGFGAAMGPLADRMVPKIRGREPIPFKNRNLLNEPKSLRAMKVASLGGLAAFYEELALNGLGLDCK